MAQSLYRTANGKIIDMNKLMNQNELEVAVSNVKINARGDELGPGGNIIRKVQHETDVGASTTPVHSHAPTQPVVSEKSIQKISPKPDLTPVVEVPNVPTQPLIEVKDTDKPHKGKQ